MVERARAIKCAVRSSPSGIQPGLPSQEDNEITTSTASRRRPVRVKLQRVTAAVSKSYPQDGEGKVWWDRLKQALGTSSSDFVNASLFQLQRPALSHALRRWQLHRTHVLGENRRPLGPLSPVPESDFL